MYNKESEITEGARWLYNMVSAAHKNLPINLFYLVCNFQLMIPQTTSMKDEGREEDFRLVLSLSLKQARTSSRYVNDNKNMP